MFQEVNPNGQANSKIVLFSGEPFEKPWDVFFGGAIFRSPAVSYVTERYGNQKNSNFQQSFHQFVNTCLTGDWNHRLERKVGRSQLFDCNVFRAFLPFLSFDNPENSAVSRVEVNGTVVQESFFDENHKFLRTRKFQLGEIPDISAADEN